MILAAGAGTRMGDLTRLTPKPLLDVGGTPILGHILANLARHGFRQVVVNLHHHGEAIEAHCGDGSRYGVAITYVHEERLLGTAGSVKNAQEHLAGNGPVLVHYGDVLTDQDLGALADTHRSRGALATLLLHRRPGSNSVVVLDGEGRITRLLERPTAEERAGVDSPWVNSGVYLLDSSVLDLIPSAIPCDFPRDVFPGLIAGGRVFGHPLGGYRCAIDSPDRLERARREFPGLRP
jgi:mannose-1-phosphate guanylyltransferase/phosphomannomutase